MWTHLVHETALTGWCCKETIKTNIISINVTFSWSPEHAELALDLYGCTVGILPSPQHAVHCMKHYPAGESAFQLPRAPLVMDTCCFARNWGSNTTVCYAHPRTKQPPCTPRAQHACPADATHTKCMQPCLQTT